MKIGSFEFNVLEPAGSLPATIALGFAAGLVTRYLLLGKEHPHADAQR